MKSPYVSELQPNQVITSLFLVQIKDIRQKKSGEPYLSMMLGDRTGDVEAKMWDNAAEVMHTFERDDFVRVKALFQIFQNRPQLTIHKMMQVDDREVDFADFFPASDARSRGDVRGTAQASIAGIVESAPAWAAGADVRGRADRARLQDWRRRRRRVHHAYLSGLIEHVLSVCTAGEADRRAL